MNRPNHKPITTPAAMRAAEKQCEELVQPNSKSLGRYIAAGTRQCKNKASEFVNGQNLCKRHARSVLERVKGEK